jgi:aspartate/methionine/tyrosine aminotransferase
VLRSLERHKHYTSICNAGPSEFLGAIAVEQGAAIHARNRGIIADNLAAFGAFFAVHKDLFEWTAPDGGCVAFPRYLGPDGAAAFCRNLVETAGVLLLPADIYASDLAPVPADRFRVGIGRRDPGPALDAIDRFLG